MFEMMGTHILCRTFPHTTLCFSLGTVWRYWIQGVALSSNTQWPWPNNNGHTHVLAQHCTPLLVMNCFPHFHCLALLDSTQPLGTALFSLCVAPKTLNQSSPNPHTFSDCLPAKIVFLLVSSAATYSQKTMWQTHGDATQKLLEVNQLLKTVASHKSSSWTFSMHRNLSDCLSSFLLFCFYTANTSIPHKTKLIPWTLSSLVERVLPTC